MSWHLKTIIESILLSLRIRLSSISTLNQFELRHDARRPI